MTPCARKILLDEFSAIYPYPYPAPRDSVQPPISEDSVACMDLGMKPLQVYAWPTTDGPVYVEKLTADGPAAHRRPATARERRPRVHVCSRGAVRAVAVRPGVSGEMRSAILCVADLEPGPVWFKIPESFAWPECPGTC